MSNSSISFLNTSVISSHSNGFNDSVITVQNHIGNGFNHNQGALQKY
jgi:hypothetical protein